MVDTFFTEKRIIKKIIIAIIFVFMFNFTFSYLGSNVVFAAEGDVMSDDEVMTEEGTGKLFIPIHSLLLFLADAALQLMQNSFISEQPVTIVATAESEKEVNGVAIAGIVIGVVVFAVACVVTYGAAAAAAGVIGTAATATAATAGSVAIAISGAVATYGGTFVGGLVFAGLAVGGIVGSTDKFIDDLKGEFDLPTIQYSPEEIFANRVPMFNINFFNPPEQSTEYRQQLKYDPKKIDTNHPYIMAKSMLAFLTYIAENNKQGEFKSAGITGEQYEMEKIPSKIESLVDSAVFEVRHDADLNGLKNGIAIDGESIMTIDYFKTLGLDNLSGDTKKIFNVFMNAKYYYGNGNKDVYDKDRLKTEGHVGVIHFFLSGDYVYMVKFIDNKGDDEIPGNGDQNTYTLYKRQLTGEEITRFFSKDGEVFKDNGYLETINLEQIMNDYLKEDNMWNNIGSNNSFDSGSDSDNISELIPGDLLIDEGLTNKDLTERSWMETY